LICGNQLFEDVVLHAIVGTYDRVLECRKSQLGMAREGGRRLHERPAFVAGYRAKLLANAFS
jgi:hypothetical protein